MQQHRHLGRRLKIKKIVIILKLKKKLESRQNIAFNQIIKNVLIK